MRRVALSIAVIAFLLLCAVCAVAQTALPPPAITVGQGGSVTLRWTAPIKRSDGSAITGALTYNLYEVTSTSGSLLQSGITTTSNVQQKLSSGTPCDALIAVEAGVESVQSAPVCVQVNAPPGVPTGFTVTVTVSVTGP